MYERNTKIVRKYDVIHNRTIIKNNKTISAESVRLNLSNTCVDKIIRNALINRKIILYFGENVYVFKFLLCV